MLEVLGLSAVESRCYELLVRTPWMTPPELSSHVDLEGAELGQVLQRLEDQGLVSVTTDEPPRLVPAPPGVAVEALVARSQQALEKARLEAAELMEVYRSGSAYRHETELVEVVRGREAQLQRFRQLQRIARHEVLALDKPPYATSPVEQQAFEIEQLRRVPVRAIYEREVLENPEATARLERLIEAGEQARVLKRVPMRLVVADRSLALVPLLPDQADVDVAALVHPCGLLDALRELFEVLWAQAVPVSFEAGDERVSAEFPSPEDRELLWLLNCGLPDRAIGRRVGVAERTVSRRVNRLMRAVGAETRFQLGIRAVTRGWVDSSQPPGVRELDVTDSPAHL